MTVDLKKMRLGDEVLVRGRITCLDVNCPVGLPVHVSSVGWVGANDITEHFPARVDIEAGMTICGKPDRPQAVGRSLKVLCVADDQAWVQNPDTGERFTVFTDHYKPVSL